MTSSLSVLSAVALIVLSEAMLFISILWSVVLHLVAQTIYQDIDHSYSIAIEMLLQVPVVRVFRIM